LLTLHVPWQVPAVVSQFITQLVKAWVCGRIDGNPGGSVGTVTVCCAKRTGRPSSKVCAWAHPTVTHKIPMASRILKRSSPVANRRITYRIRRRSV
jgi:hypothetical protein